jgi:hypothetical protein
MNFGHRQKHEVRGGLVIGRASPRYYVMYGIEAPRPKYFGKALRFPETGGGKEDRSRVVKRGRERGS